MIVVHGLAVAPGDGRLVRRAGGILFVPGWGDGAEVVLEAFRSAPTDDIMDAVPASVVDSDFEVPPFACVTWSPRITLLVFGDLEVRTDHPALPMLSGATSQTWVEHTLRGVTDRVVVTVDPPDDDRAPSDLEAGVVPGGGFALELATATDRPATAGDPGVGASRAAGGASEPTATLAPSRPAPDDTASAAPGEAPDEAPDETLEPARGGGHTPPVPDPTVGGDGGPGRSLVQAVRCDDGHLTAAGSTACRVCGKGVAPGAPASLVPRPSLGMLALDDGQVLELDRNYRIGRKPESDERATAVRVEGEKVSRVHVEVMLREWDVLVRDCNSTNGTWIASSAQARFRRVEPDVPVRIEPGTVIRVDRRTMTFLVHED